MQEPKSDNDEELITKVNEALNNPGGSGSGRGLLDSSSTPSEQEMQNLLQNMNQDQLMRLIGNMNEFGGNGAAGLLAQITQAAGGGSPSVASEPKTPESNRPNNSGEGSAATATSGSAKPAAAGGASSGSSKPSVQLEDLQKILSGIQPGSSGSSVDLAAGVNTEFVKRITASPKTVQKLTPLLPRFGYEGSKPGDSEEVVDTLISPAFQNALSSFCSAFPTGQLGPLVEQFEFGTEAVTAARNGNMEAFLSAIQKEVDNKKPSGESPSEVINYKQIRANYIVSSLL